jgi:hypothetical protein
MLQPDLPAIGRTNPARTIQLQKVQQSRLYNMQEPVTLNKMNMWWILGCV